MDMMKADEILTAAQAGAWFSEHFDMLYSTGLAFFRGDNWHERDELTSKAMALAWENAQGLISSGRATPGLLQQTFRYACQAAPTRNVRAEHYSAKCMMQCDTIKIKHIDINEFIKDERDSIPDAVATKLDMESWLDGLDANHRERALDLMVGNSPSDCADRWGVSRPAVSCERKYLEASYANYTGDR